MIFRSHMKQHKVVNTKLVPLVHDKNNVDEDTFLVVPKSSVPRGRFISRRYVITLDKIDKTVCRIENDRFTIHESLL